MPSATLSVTPRTPPRRVAAGALSRRGGTPFLSAPSSLLPARTLLPRRGCPSAPFPLDPVVLPRVPPTRTASAATSDPRCLGHHLQPSLPRRHLRPSLPLPPPPTLAASPPPTDLPPPLRQPSPSPTLCDLGAPLMLLAPAGASNPPSLTVASDPHCLAVASSARRRCPPPPPANALHPPPPPPCCPTPP